MSVLLRIDGRPVPQPRHRVGRSGAYLPDDHPVHGWKAAVAAAARVAWRHGPLADPFHLDFLFVMPLAAAGPTRVYAGTRPDIDNLNKAVMDALTGVVYEDDSQVVSVRASKVFARLGERPHALVRVTPVYPDVIDAEEWWAGAGAWPHPAGVLQ